MEQDDLALWAKQKEGGWQRAWGLRGFGTSENTLLAHSKDATCVQPHTQKQGCTSKQEISLK